MVLLDSNVYPPGHRPANYAEIRGGPGFPERRWGKVTSKPAIRKARWVSGKPGSKGSTIRAFETCHPIDAAPPAGEKMLLPRNRRSGAEGGSKQFQL